ncbi:ABC transporter permease [Aggregatilinea lenta]|uniref:ABC transporter permease n=1 Tax=Aggregatilinea lenta TaxID=913108 RepID=UPI000E5C3862|nr:ABC transporter permease [Aggregatilinea lenta]
MAWNKVKLVLLREYLFNFKRPSFLFTAFGVPALTLVAMFFIIQFTANRETNTDAFQKVGYIDRSGIITEAAPGFETFAPVTDVDVEVPGENATPDEIADYSDTLQQRAEQQLGSGVLDAYFVVPDNYVLTGLVDLYADQNIPEALQNDVEDFMRAQIAARAPDDLAVSADRLADPVDVVLRDIDTDDELGEYAVIGRILLPFLFAFLYFMATNTTAQFLMNGVVEEKENRLMEILATSLRPIELLWGKLLGLGALALTQIVLWVVAGIAIASQFDEAREFIGGGALDAPMLLLFLVVFVLNFALFSAIMLGIGAAVTAEAESRQFASIVTLINVLPIMLLSLYFVNPDGVVPVFFMFFPLTAGVGLIMRIGLTDIPLWQIGISLVIQVVATIVIMWLAAKVFRLGMLMYGKRLTPRALWAALREGSVTLTTATQEMDVLPAGKQKRSMFRR